MVINNRRKIWNKLGVLVLLGTLYTNTAFSGIEGVIAGGVTSVAIIAAGCAMGGKEGCVVGVAIGVPYGALLLATEAALN